MMQLPYGPKSYKIGLAV